MAQIICITTGLTGVLHASFEVVSRLKQAGHQVIYACPWDVEEKVTRQGFDYLQLAPVNFDPAPDLPDVRGGPFIRWRRMGNRLMKARERRAKAIEALGMDEFVKVLDTLNPDLILIDLELHDYILTAIGNKTPTVLLSQWFSLWERPNLPPVNQSTIPGISWKGHRLGIKLAWLKIRIKRIRSVWKKRLLTAFTDRGSILLHYAKQVSFPTKELIEYHAFPPPLTYRTLPVISLTAWELEFPHKPRPNLFYVGPMVYVDRQDTSENAGVDKQLAQIFKARQEQKSKLIYCSLSTFQKGDKEFVKRVVEAVSDRPDWQLIIGLGGLIEEGFLEDPPENVHAFGWVPQLQVLRQADCSINHGGIHTINECIHFGVPMLIYSGKRHDQDGCAARVSFHGVGIMADKDVDDARMIQSRIETILTDPSFKARINEINMKISKQKDQLVKVVEDFLEAQV